MATQRTFRPWSRRFAVWAPLVLLLVLVGGPLLVAQRHPGGDGPHMLGIAMRLGWELRTGQLFAFVSHFMSLVAPHPPGAYVPATLLYALLGPHAAVPVLAGLCWLALAWDGGVRMLRHTPGRAWVLAVGLAATPLVWHQVDNYGVDIASAALVAQALSWLMASDGLRDRRASLLAGAWIGAGFWVKYTFPIFLFAPCLVLLADTAWVAFRRHPDWRARATHGLILCGGLALVGGPLLAFRGREIARYVTHSATLDGSDETIDSLGSSFGADVSSFDFHMFYPAVLKDLLGWPGTVLLALGLVLLALELRRNRGGLRDSVLLLVCVGSGIAVLSLLNSKADRYLLPVMLPVMVLGLSALGASVWRAVLPVVVFAAPILFLWRDFSGWTHGLPTEAVTAWGPTSGNARRAPPGRRFEHLASTQLSQWGTWPRVEEAFRPIDVNIAKWQLDVILADMHTRIGSDTGTVGLCLTEQNGTPGFGLFLMAAEQQGLHWEFATVRVLRGQGDDGQLRTFQFRGPFSNLDDEETPFPTLFVSYRQGGYSPPLAYLMSLPATDATTYKLPSGLEGQVVTLPMTP